ncbi:cytochrome-c oxidase, cbb3-type subunit III [Pelagibius sp. Alg239-R121]|uniref:cytochrome-c oxidase, cbb3-type subunit III n=1 Tax=Pelagibius sp. Alg239-R121 TaxID=2993448 RepID=UPI0024A74014|nr:cytochrome-c oxidase, cbb3-type subunit III [Pelagibius sp. Alg239-R121]
MALEERDPVTGRMTTGHEWNGIKELDTPVPKVVIFFLSLASLIAVIYWVLLPAWPLGTTYTKGILGVDQRATVKQRLEDAQAERSAWMQQIEQGDAESIRADPNLMRIVRESGRTLFGDNCAVCHGIEGTGGKGYPSLTDEAWLWGGDAESIAETLRVGINAAHDETRASQMLAFGKDELLTRSEIGDLVSYVRSLGKPGVDDRSSAEEIARGEEAFIENCASCHGDSAEGDIEQGAPNLTDNEWIYGGDRRTLHTTIYSGRQGQMPSWQGRLSDAERQILTLYILSLQEK